MACAPRRKQHDLRTKEEATWLAHQIGSNMSCVPRRKQHGMHTKEEVTWLAHQGA